MGQKSPAAALKRLAPVLLLLLMCGTPAATPDARLVWAASGQLELIVVDDETGRPIPCRVHLRNAAGKPQRATGTPFWHDHFIVPGKITLRLPLGNYAFELERGLETLVLNGRFALEPFADDSKELRLRRFVDMSAHGWWSGDLDVRRPIRDVELLIEADDLHVAQVVSWSKDKNAWARTPPPEDPLVRFGGDRYYHVMAGVQARAGGSLFYFNLPAPLALEDAGAEFPPPSKYLDSARRHSAAWIEPGQPSCWDLPMLVARGRLDSIRVAHSQICRDTVIDRQTGGKPRDRVLFPGKWGGPRWSQAIYFHLLNCGLRIPPTAGSGSGVTPNPVGYNRLYVHVDGEFSYEKWWQSLRAGRVTITNGPLLRPLVHGELPGHVFLGTNGDPMELEIGLTLSTREKISYLEIIKNGRVEHSVRLEEYAKTGKLPNVQFHESGWFLVRAVADRTDTYRFAMTGPYYVEFDGAERISKQSAQFFLDWVYERARQIKLEDPAQQAAVLAPHREARDFWQDLVDRANAP